MGAIYFGAVGALCAALVYAVMREFVAGLSHRSAPEVFETFTVIGGMAFVAACGTTFLLWPVLRFDTWARGFASGAVIGVLSHIPFSALYVGSSVLLLGYAMEDFVQGFSAVLLIGWVFAILPEAIIGGIAGAVWSWRQRRR